MKAQEGDGKRRGLWVRNAGAIVLFNSVFRCDFFFFFQAEDGIRYLTVTGVQTCALPISTAFVPDRLQKLLAHQPLRLAPPEAVAHGRQPAQVDQAAIGIDELGHGRCLLRSGERRGGEEGRSRGAADHLKKKKKKSMRV